MTAVGVEDLVDERLLQGEHELIDWKAATNVMGENEETSTECVVKPKCEGISLDEWTLALQAIAQLGESLVENPSKDLDLTQVAMLKQRLRALDVGTLLTVRAFNQYGPKRLAAELKELLA